MVIRILSTLLLGFATLVAIHGTAVAQVEPPGYVSIMRQPGHLTEFPPLLKRSFIPVQVRAIEGPQQVAPGEQGLFTARANVESATLPIRSQWDFGDGATSAGLSARHAYAQPGTYLVKFRLWNDQSEDTDSLVVTVGSLQAPHSITTNATPARTYEAEAVYSKE